MRGLPPFERETFYEGYGNKMGESKFFKDSFGLVRDRFPIERGRDGK